MAKFADYILAMAKHLPPSSAELQLVDIGSVAGEILSLRRPDIQALAASLRVDDWTFGADSVDAVVGYDILLSDALLAQVLRVMRAGGRFIVVQPTGHVDETWLRTLENAGYVRILVEPAADGVGVLIRGEKAHTTDDTHARINLVADQDLPASNLDDFRGRYVYVLIRQTPNKPAWKLQPDEQVEWHAVTVIHDAQNCLVGFSSLPKAVSMMQPAVLHGWVHDVNKVAKFKPEIVQSWGMVVLINPEWTALQQMTPVWFAINPDLAEIPDE